MRKKMSAILSLLIVSLLLFGITSFSATSTGKTANAFAKNLTITWIAPGASQVTDGNWAEKRLEAKFNVNIKVTKCDTSNDEQINLILASGEMTDVLYPYGNDLDMWKQKLLRSIPHSMIRRYAPNFAKMFDSKPVTWLTSLVPGKKKEFIAIPGISDGISGPAFVSNYRLDWLEKLGIEPHGTLKTVVKDKMYWSTEPFTFDEMQNIFTKFVNNDPDGNGKKDTYNTVAYKDTLMWNYVNIADSFGFVWNKNMMEGGQLKQWYISNGYRDFLKWMNGMYKKGLVDKELTILDFNKMWEKIASGKVGYWMVPYTYIGPISETIVTNPPQSVLQKNPEAKILITPPEKGKSGKSVGYQYLPIDGLTTSYHIFINKKVTDEKLARILQILDYCNFDKDARVWTSYGEEGKNWKWSGTPYKSQVATLEGITPETQGKIGAGIFRYWGVWTSNWLAITETPELGVVSEWIRDPNQGGKIANRDYRYDLFNETKQVDINKQYGSEINTQVAEFMFKSVIGEVDPVKGWDSYVKKLMSSGLDKLLEEIKKAPLVEELHKGVVKY